MALALSPADHRLQVRRPDGSHRSLAYDPLVVVTGAAPARPAIDGLALPGIHVLHTMADRFRLHEPRSRRPT
jgi:NADPH-dependent 2,4-dienoyl-CoA reductase/sulfur reductase-like enzyme